jgi:hypothetical protein
MHHRRPYTPGHIQHSMPPLYLLVVPEVSKHVNLLPKHSVSHLLPRLVLVCTRLLEGLAAYISASQPKVLHGRQLLTNSDLLKCTELPQGHMLGPHHPPGHRGPSASPGPYVHATSLSMPRQQHLQQQQRPYGAPTAPQPGPYGPPPGVLRLAPSTQPLQGLPR